MMYKNILNVCINIHLVRMELARVPENRDETDRKKTRKNILGIIEDISYIIDYEFHDIGSIYGGIHTNHTIPDIANIAHKRRKMLKNKELETIGGTVKSYNTFYSNIWNDNVEWTDNNANIGLITNINDFVFALFQSDLGGVNIYIKEDIDRYEVKWNEKDQHWYIEPSYEYVLYKFGQLQVKSKVGDEEDVFGIEKDNNDSYIALASRIYELYTKYTSNKVLMRVGAIWSRKSKEEHGLKYLKDKLTSL